jgi:uncharacterized membrane protein HdeD (DUF308 family)
MRLARGFLILTGVIILGFGIYCLFDPFILSDATGMGLSNPTALIEVTAMYGGLQISVGLYLLYASLQAERVLPALLVSVFLFAGLAGARSYGLAINAGDNGYNFVAVIYEIVSGLLALWLLQINGRRVDLPS